MAIRLNSYRPLCINMHGREAVVKYGLPPFIDSSCRRDPDLQNPYPSTTSLCRGENFVPTLSVGDIIVYFTRTGNYGIYSSGNRVLTSILEVAEIYETHEEAAEWYLNHHIELPSNCMVPGNPPYPWEQTAGVNSRDFDNIADWDAFYYARSKRISTFVRTNKLFCELYNPPVITNEMLIDVFGRIPNTQTPPTICEKLFKKLLKNIELELELDRKSVG